MWRVLINVALYNLKGYHHHQLSTQAKKNKPHLLNILYQTYSNIPYLHQTNILKMNIFKETVQEKCNCIAIKLLLRGFDGCHMTLTGLTLNLIISTANIRGCAPVKIMLALHD